MTKIESVRVFLSPHNIKDGEDIGPGLAVIINPMPTDEIDIIQLMADIAATVKAFGRKWDCAQTCYGSNLPT